MKVIQLVLCFFVLTFSSWSFAEGQKIPPSEYTRILAEVDKHEGQTQDMKAELHLVLISKDGKKRTRRAVFFQKGKDTRLIQFKHPSDVRGLSTLVKGNQVMLYLPQFAKVKRIAAHVKNQPFMGTDLSFDDMGTMEFSADWKIEEGWKTKKGLTITISNKKTQSKRILLLNSNHVVQEVYFLDERGQKRKHMIRKDFATIKKYSIPLTVVMKDLRSGHKTLVLLKKLSVDTGISQRKFTTRYLKRDLDLE